MASSSDEKSQRGDQESDRNHPNLRLSDCKCPICMCILIEPVRMPCNHELCMPCFRKNVEEANFTCPMCRLRISNWARRRARENKLVDERRWRQILQAFPDRCQRRMAGEEEEEEEDALDVLPVMRICEPGAIKQEYIEAIEKLRRERQQMEEMEIKKSEEYIAWLQREEVRVYEEQQKELARQQKLDEELARKMSQGDSPMQEEIRARILHEQAAKDEEFARKLQREMLKSPGAMSSPPSTTTTIVSKRTSRNSSRSSNASTSSSIKCRRIDTFLSPSAKQTSPQSHSSSKASFSKSTNNAASSSPILSISSTSSLRASSDSSASSVGLDFDKPSTSNGEQVEPVLIGDPPWGDQSSSDLILEIVADPASPDVSYPSPCSDSESGKSFKGCLLNPEFVLDAKEAQMDDSGAEKGNKKESAFESVKTKSLEGEITETKCVRQRSDSMNSVDSISPELNHFRPIEVSPRTAHRRLANGRKESPKIVHTTPRNLTTNLPQEDSSGDASLPPLVKAKFESLIKEKKRKLTESSKATMTGKAVPGSTSSFMRQELNKRLHRKPSGGRLTLSATHKQNTKPEKSPLAEDRPKAVKYNQQSAAKNLNIRTEKNNSSTKYLKQGIKQPDVDDDNDVIMKDLDGTSLPSVDTGERSKLEGLVSINGNAAHAKRSQETEIAVKETGSDRSNCIKRKSSSPQMHSKRQRLENASSPQTAREISTSSAADRSPGSVKKSPGKVYRMKANQPRPKPSNIRQLNFNCEDNGTAHQDDSVSSKQTKIPSGDSNTPPLPSLIPSPHGTKSKSDIKKDVPVTYRKTTENFQENVSRVETDRHKPGIITPDKGVLMDTTQGSNLERNREQNGNVGKVKLGDMNSPNSKKSNSKSPTEIRTSSQYLPAKAKAKVKNTSPSSCNDLKKATSPSLHQKTPSKTRRNTIWKYMELVSEEERRFKQEEEDRKLALRLQKELNKQERQQMTMVDRSHGTEAAYELRERYRGSSRKTAAVVDIDSDDDIFA